MVSQSTKDADRIIAEDVYFDTQPGPSRVSPSNLLDQLDPLAGDDGGGNLVGDNDDSSYEDVVGENDEDKQQHFRDIFENYVFDQFHRPRRRDIVSYNDVDFEDWMRVRIIGTEKPSSIQRDYLNIKFL